MKDVQETLDKLAPGPARMSDWAAVLREARPRRRSPVLQLAVATGIAGLAALFVVAPWKGSERVGVLDKALAAVGDGPVLHVVFRGEWGGTRIDLETGARTPVYGEREVWYDPKRDLVHQVSRLGGVVEHDSLYERNPKDAELTALWQQYRGALERGTARLVGQDVIDGVPVHWIIVRSQMLPDVADKKDHEWAQQVAVSQETYKPVAMRYTRDRKAPEGVTERILRYETVSTDEADFTKPQEPSLDGMAFREGHEPIELEQATDVLGRKPYWLGDRHAGLPLAQVSRLEVATGTRAERVLRGEEAVKAKRCLDLLHARARAGGPARRQRPQVCRSIRYSIESRGRDVITRGPVQWTSTKEGVVLFYGTLGDDPTLYRTQSVPQFDKPYVSITQATDPGVMVRGTPMGYVPPEGSIVVIAKRFGYLVLDGMHISMQAPDEQALLAAARALRPLSAGSGAGG
jgi:hypothetical protein